MAEHRTGTREEWQGARDELAKLEAEQGERNAEIRRKRRDLPWVPVEQEYVFDTPDGKKTLADLFDGRSQLLAYNVMYGPDYENGACPGCTNLVDCFSEAMVLHLNKRDVTLLCFSRAPIERLTAYRERMRWPVPYVSTYETDFPWTFGLALTEEQAQEIPEVKEMIANPPEWLQDWAGQVGAELKDGLREGPSWIAFARGNGTVYHTYTALAPNPFVATYMDMLLDGTPKGDPFGAEPRDWRKDEYPERRTTYAGLIKKLPVPAGFEAPRELRYEDIVARALTRADLADDVGGINASIELIQRTRGGDWPTGLVTEDEDFVDLVWHECEFRENYSFSYALYDAAGGYLGCCYLYPVGRRTPISAELAECDVDASWWVTPDAYDRCYYAKLHAALGRWVAEEFPFDRLHYSNAEVPAG